MRSLLLFVCLACLTACASLEADSPSTPGTVFRDCALACPSMVVIPGGDFLMGSVTYEPGRQDAEGPQRRVRVSALAFGKFDVTVAEWRAFVEASGHKSVGGCAWASLSASGGRPDPEASWDHVEFLQDDSHPVVCVTWADANAYAQWLSTRTGRRYRLPTEAEWEYAARAGTPTPYPWGVTASHEHANYGNEKCCSGLAEGGDRWVATSPVGAFAPNAFGLHDMNGNVMQWVQDCLSDYADLGASAIAFQEGKPLKESSFLLRGMAGTSACAYRMLRGGDWGNPPRMIRSASRNYAPPRGSTIESYKSGGVGFRVVQEFDALGENAAGGATERATNGPRDAGG